MSRFGASSQWPPANDANDMPRLELKDDLQPPSAKHLLKPMSLQMKQVFVGSALEAVLAAAAERPPSNEDSPPPPIPSSLGGLRRSFVTSPAEQLMTITILLVSANLKVRKEALDGFIESHAMLSEFVPFEVILKIRGREVMPIDHWLILSRTCPFSVLQRRPNILLMRCPSRPYMEARSGIS